jgi:Flp pilus assembly pilin Flp
MEKEEEMAARIRRFAIALVRDEEGATLVEYILLATLIGVAAIAGMTFLGQVTNNKMNNIGTTVGT